MLRVDAELGFAFRGFPPAFVEPVATYLAHYRRPARPGDRPPLVVDAAPIPPPAPGEPPAEPRLRRPGLEVWSTGERLEFRLPGLRVACGAASGRGWIELDAPSDDTLRRFVTAVLPSLLAELAQSRGYYAVHAAAVAPRGRAVLLPGKSGSGKSTLFARAHRAGLSVLSDDSVWLCRSRDGEDGFRVVAFPRGAPAQPAPGPTLDDAPLAAIVCPRIVDAEANLVEAIAPREALDELIRQSGLLGRGEAVGRRFDLLASAAAAVPCYSLHAGRRRGEVPALLRRLV